MSLWNDAGFDRKMAFATERAGVVPQVLVAREGFAVGDAEFVDGAKRRFRKALLLTRDRVVSDMASLVAAMRRSVRERRKEF